MGQSKLLFILYFVLPTILTLSIDFQFSYIQPYNNTFWRGQIIAQPYSIPYTIQYLDLQDDWFANSRFLYIPTFYATQFNGHYFDIRVRITSIEGNKIQQPISLQIKNYKIKFVKQQQPRDRHDEQLLSMRIVVGETFVNTLPHQQEQDLSFLYQKKQQKKIVKQEEQKEQKQIEYLQKQYFQQIKSKINLNPQLPIFRQIKQKIKQIDNVQLLKSVQSVTGSQLTCQFKIAYLLKIQDMIAEQIQVMKKRQYENSYFLKRDRLNIEILKEDVKQIQSDILANSIKIVSYQSVHSRQFAMLQNFYSSFQKLKMKHKILSSTQTNVIEKDLSNAEKKLINAKFTLSKAKIYSEFNSNIQRQTIDMYQQNVKSAQNQFLQQTKKQKQGEAKIQQIQAQMDQIKVEYLWQEIELQGVQRKLQNVKEKERKLKEKRKQKQDQILQIQKSMSSKRIEELLMREEDLLRNFPNIKQELKSLGQFCFNNPNFVY